MTALTFSKQQESMGTCDGEGCIAKGRHLMYLAGYPVQSPTPRLTRTMLCPKCKREAERIWRGALG